LNAPAVTQRAMRHVKSMALVDFAEIYDDTVELVSVTVPPSSGISNAIQTLLGEPGLQIQWVQGSSDSSPSPSGRRRDLDEALNILRSDIETPVEVLQELLDCESCGVRIKVLEGPMCPRFHVDRVPCRMLMTYSGPGTEWIAYEDLNRSALAEGDAVPLREGRSVKHLDTGSWSLLKGGTWDGVFSGVMHRSPTSTERRVLVSIDPIFSGD